MRAIPGKFDPRAYRAAMNRFGGARRRRPMFSPPGQGQGGGGYSGIEGILAALQKGVNPQQLANMAAGKTGGNGWGSIGGMGGAMSGLSPYATHWLATSGILDPKEAELMSTEGLEGAELNRATLMNNLLSQNAQANPMYELDEGIDADFLGQIFGAGFGGKGAYEKGYGAGGRTPGFGGNGPRPFRPPIRRKGRRPGGGGRLIRKGRGYTPGIDGGATIGQPGNWF